MPAIPFTQYLRPDGRTRTTFAETDAETHQLAQGLLAAGYVFETEVLPYGAVSMTVEKGEECVAHEVVPNGPEIVEALVRLVRTAVAGAAAVP